MYLKSASRLSLVAILAQALPLSQPVDTTTSKEKKMESTQQFRYFLVMDFEATCWDGGQPTTAQEIIEFPAVLVDAVTLENVAEFREFVRPTWNPRLSVTVAVARLPQPEYLSQGT